jgi:hypothetical protein
MTESLPAGAPPIRTSRPWCSQPFWIEPGRIIAIQRDSLGVVTVVSYRLEPPEQVGRVQFLSVDGSMRSSLGEPLGVAGHEVAVRDGWE